MVGRSSTGAGAQATTARGRGIPAPLSALVLHAILPGAAQVHSPNEINAHARVVYLMTSEDIPSGGLRGCPRGAAGRAEPAPLTRM